MPHPRTIPEAIDFLKAHLPPQTLDLIRGAQPFDPAEAHFGLGMWIRNNLGLHESGSELLRACNTTDADAASPIILRALWESLLGAATPEELARSREVRRGYDADRKRQMQELMDAKAAKDAAITDRRCPHCGKPCPSYRKTCKYCRKAV